MTKAQRVASEPLDFPRADPVALKRFDPRTKVCDMNCGPHRLDPRTLAERKLLCVECIQVTRSKNCERTDCPDGGHGPCAQCERELTGGRT